MLTEPEIFLLDLSLIHICVAAGSSASACAADAISSIATRRIDSRFMGHSSLESSFGGRERRRRTISHATTATAATGTAVSYTHLISSYTSLPGSRRAAITHESP